MDRGVSDPVDYLALLVEDIVVLEQALANRVILLLDLLLRGFDGAIEKRVLQFLALLHRSLHQAGREVALQEQAHEVILEREEELGESGVSLAGAAAAQLAVDAPGFVALGADHVEAALLADAFAQLDVGSAAGHVGRDRDGALQARPAHDLGLLLVELRI